MDWALAAAFAGVSMLFVLTPGVDWAYAIASGVRDRSGVLPAVSGMLAGHLLATLVVSAGVAAALAASETAMTVLTVAGALFLLWLGIKALTRPVAPEPECEDVPAGTGRLLARGVGISLLNPKVLLLFLALLPQFVSTGASWGAGAQMVALGVVHVANCALVYLAVGYGASAVLARRPRSARVVVIASGAAMIVLGAALIGESILDRLT
jgi:threonine/homoserine/homoserine lactone efflux protein